jgi:hypothetical protein
MIMSEPYIRTYLAHITDTTDDTAVAKIEAAYSTHLGRCGLRDVDFRVKPGLNTIDIGFKASELINNSQRPDRLILALNYAPPDKKEGTKDNARNDFFFADLGDEIYAGGTCNGFELSYVKDRIQALYRLTTTNALKSQFRSLEVLPRHIVQFCVPKERAALIASGALQAVAHIDEIVPTVPDRTHVLEVDNFRNVKLFTSKADGQALAQAHSTGFCFGLRSIEFDRGQSDVTSQFNAIVNDTLFAAQVGTNVVARHSSSRLSGNRPVPMIANIRIRPAETEPPYDVPKIGHPVHLTPVL